MGPFSVIYQQRQIRKIYCKFSLNALLPAHQAEETMFNSFHAVKRHMYVQRQRAEDARSRARAQTKPDG